MRWAARTSSASACPGRFPPRTASPTRAPWPQNLGIRFEIAPISPAYDEFLNVLDPLFAGAPRDVTEENLQSRLRGVTLMALSNKWGALVLTTGNKSELAVGYCTLYGDMCGGLAVISDVPKTLVYSLSRVANRRHTDAIPESVFEKPPSAELRPDQKDTDSPARVRRARPHSARLRRRVSSSRSRSPRNWACRSIWCRTSSTKWIATNTSASRPRPA